MQGNVAALYSQVYMIEAIFLQVWKDGKNNLDLREISESIACNLKYSA